MRRPPLRLVLLIVAVMSGGCGGENSAPAGPVVQVAITDLTFSPAEVSVTAGGSVRWTNTSRTERHNIIPVTASSFKKHDGLIAGGDSVTIPFTKAGDYAYYCSLHGTPTSGQRGMVRVTP